MTTISLRYKTSDGREFRDKGAADLHQLGLEMDPEINRYMDTLKLKASTERGVRLSRARLRRTLLKYFVWQKQQRDDIGPDRKAKIAAE